MAHQKINAAGFGSLFEEDYLLRTFGHIDPDARAAREDLRVGKQGSEVELLG